MCVVLIMNGRLCFNLNKAPNCSASPCQKFPFLLQTVVAFQLHCWLEWACLGEGEGGRQMNPHTCPSSPSDGCPWDPEIVWGVRTQRWHDVLFSTLYKTLPKFIYLVEKNINDRQTAHHAQVPAGELSTLNLSNKFLLFSSIVGRLQRNVYFSTCIPSLDLPNSHMERYKTGGPQLFIEQKAVNNAICICRYSCWGNNFLNQGFGINFFIPTTHVKFYFTINLSEDFFLKAFISFEFSFPLKVFFSADKQSDRTWS